MVTVTHSDIDSYYMEIEDWLSNGITYNAIILCADQWCKADGIRDYQFYFIVNENVMTGKTIKVLNRW